MTIEDVIIDEDVIGREIVNATHEEWINFVFDHPHTEKPLLSREDFADWALPSSETVDYLFKTFEEADALLKRFSEDQVGDGFWYISSKTACTLWDDSVPLVTRQKAARSMRKLYSDCFAARCAPLLLHLNDSGDHPLNGTCYMWWDLMRDFTPIDEWPKNSTRKQINNEFLAVMEFALGLESVACQESALHGLGHWAEYCPDRVQEIIDRFIMGNPSANPNIIKYSWSAREGKVL